ncbi:MAG: hypothetical protein QM811_18860 [Pirellulales bacterium]
MTSLVELTIVGQVSGDEYRDLALHAERLESLFLNTVSLNDDENRGFQDLNRLPRLRSLVVLFLPIHGTSAGSPQIEADAQNVVPLHISGFKELEFFSTEWPWEVFIEGNPQLKSVIYDQALYGKDDACRIENCPYAKTYEAMNLY